MQKEQPENKAYSGAPSNKSLAGTARKKVFPRIIQKADGTWLDSRTGQLVVKTAKQLLDEKKVREAKAK